MANVVRGDGGARAALWPIGRYDAGAPRRLWCEPSDSKIPVGRMKERETTEWACVARTNVFAVGVSTLGFMNE